MRRLQGDTRRLPSLLAHLLGPLMGIAVVSILLSAVLNEISATGQADGLVRQRGQTVLAGLAERLQERETEQLVYGGLIATSEVTVDSIARADAVGAAQALIPRRSRFLLGFVHAYTGSGTPLLTLGNPLGLEVQPIVRKALAGVEVSTVLVVDDGVLLVAAVPVKADTGIVGAILVGRPLDGAALEELARSKGLLLVLRHDGKVLASSTSLPVADIEAGLPEAAQGAELTVGGERFRAEATALDDGELLALVPVEDLRHAATKRRATTLAITLGLLGALAAVAWFRARTIRRSLKAMVVLAGLMAGGDFDQRVQPMSTRELDDLGVAVNNLAGQITHRMHDLVHNARHDALTGLANRTLLSERATASLSQRRSGEFGLLFIDLDNFKAVNDSLGHEVGDQVLVAVANILRSHVRGSDLPVRLGGDEFAVLVDGAASEAELVAMAKRLLAAFSVPLTLANRQVVAQASIGIATVDAHHWDVDTLLRNSDVALYLAKQQGKGRYAIFHPDMHADIVDRILLKADLARALDGEELAVHYQPLVDLVSGDVIGAEALLRWTHPTRGPVPPDTFIPIAEESGLIEPIGRWVLHEACREAARWMGEHAAPMHVSVNLSVRQLQSPRIIGDIELALADARLPAELLTLEVTESLLMQPGTAPEVLGLIRGLGARLAIDDFGTGFSSLAYLQTFPIDILKIDRSFVTPLSDGGNGALVKSIIGIARALDAETVAEGIEDVTQAQTLRLLGCTTGQGYLFARAMPAADLGRYVTQQNHRISNRTIG